MTCLCKVCMYTKEVLRLRLKLSMLYMLINNHVNILQNAHRIGRARSSFMAGLWFVSGPVRELSANWAHINILQSWVRHLGKASASTKNLLDLFSTWKDVWNRGAQSIYERGNNNFVFKFSASPEEDLCRKNVSQFVHVSSTYVHLLKMFWQRGKHAGISFHLYKMLSSCG